MRAMDAQDQKEDSASPRPTTEATREHLEALIKRAAAKDAIKDYNAAAELYSEATETQAKLNGELSLENANLLFAYGKALYNVAISKSDVLGSKVAGQAQAPPDSAAHKSAPVTDSLIKNAVSTSAVKKETQTQEAESEKDQDKPYFQFTGDENFDTDSEEEDADKTTGGDDEDDDDFANAFEILDLARILYHKKLSAFEEDSGKGKSTASVPELNDIREHLADTYDLQAEISLEAERFSDAITDLRAALELRQSLFPVEDPSIAECHYKLSLALEFGAVMHDDDSESGSKPAKIDERMRKEAVVEMENAIESCRARMSQEQKKLENDGSLDEDKRTALKRKIANVKEITSDMEQRLLDLRRPAVSVEKGLEDQSDIMIKGLLGQIMGESETNKQSALERATKNATDLSAFVKRKPAGSKSLQQANTATKRPAQEQTHEDGLKRARVDDVDGTST